MELRTGTIRRFAGCFRDLRNPDLIEHSVEELLRQRIGALSMGYEDLKDHDNLRYKKTIPQASKIELLLIEEGVKAIPRKSRRIVLDFDATNDARTHRWSTQARAGCGPDRTTSAPVRRV